VRGGAYQVLFPSVGVHLIVLAVVDAHLVVVREGALVARYLRVPHEVVEARLPVPRTTRGMPPVCTQSRGDVREVSKMAALPSAVQCVGTP